MKLKIYVWKEAPFLCDYADGLLVAIEETEEEAKEAYLRKEGILRTDEQIHDAVKEDKYWGSFEVCREHFDNWTSQVLAQDWGPVEVHDIESGFCESLGSS
jgi:hypothetical protein